MAKTKEEMEREILEVQHAKAMLDLDQTREDNAQRQQKKTVTKRVNEERQRGFKTVREGQEERFRRCTHRQGGKMHQLDVRDTNQSVLAVMRMPDGFTRIISCPVCRGHRVSPHPYLQRKVAFKAGFHVTATGIVLERDESPTEVRDRLAKFADDTAEFNALMKQSRDKLIDVPEMDCGTVHVLTNSETGDPVLPWRQSDVWPYAPAGYAAAKKRQEAA